jgi:Asp-tRNA(Asn)/Glu-tRNA(Gln) amidotransferase A subunit family amidase
LSRITLLSATEQLALLRTEKISPLELAEEHVREIDRLNPRLNAIVHWTDVDAERIRMQARAMMTAPQPRGPLYGLPMTIKSSIEVSGLHCEVGSVLRRGMMAAQDAVVVTRVRQAGANILGTTNCPEFLMAYETDNRLHGQTSNPWNLDFTAGGSSGGESAAIASGMSAAGLGSDSGGSVRTPAHFTGICSLKPTPGRIPTFGHVPACVGPFSVLGAIGPMARTMQDVRLMFETLCPPDPTDPISPPIALRSIGRSELKRIPIGYFEDDGLVPVTAETRVAIQAAVRALRQQGFSVRPFRPASLEAARKLWWKFFVRCGAMFIDSIVAGKHEQLSPVLLDFLSIAHQEPPLSGDELLWAWADLDRVRSQMLQEMKSFPVWLCPACAIPAFRHGERSWVIGGQRVDYLDAMRYTQWFNLLGAPAAVVPVGRSPEGMPIGVQVAGRPFEDEIVLGIADAIDKEFGFVPPPMSTGQNSVPRS